MADQPQHVHQHTIEDGTSTIDGPGEDEYTVIEYKACACGKSSVETRRRVMKKPPD
ncbi:hypothetical protein JNJ66_06645 [Candidatus Saccharibacteria bacterium]|nr:hypothetical protein [Candidatus Saccharibacteria bacterium]